MRARLLTTDSPEWRLFLADVAHDFYHLPQYVRLAAATEGGGEPLAVLAEDGTRAMLLPVIVREIPEAGARLDGTSPYGYPGPLVRGDGGADFMADACHAMKTVLCEHGLVSLFVRLHPLLNSEVSALEAVGTVVDHGETVSIDLTQPDEELWRQTMSGHRNEINRALRAGHRAYFDDGERHLSSFVQLYRATMERVGADPYYLFSESYFVSMREALGPSLHLCVVDIGGTIAAGGLFTEVSGTVEYHLSGTHEAFARERPTKLMLHHVRAWAKARGNRHMHLGGGLGASADSLFRFKAGFSNSRCRFRTWRVVLDEHAYARLVPAQAFAADRSGFFPSYRRRASHVIGKN